MSTMAEIELPASEFALRDSLAAFPDARFEVVRMAANDRQLTPYVQVTGDNFDSLLATLDEDPSVDNVDLLDKLNREYLFRMDWKHDINTVLYMVSEESAAVVKMHGQGDSWHLRVLFPDRESLPATRDFCDREGLTFTVKSIYDLQHSTQRGGFGLSKDQYEALVTAAKEGYFDVPRSITMEELSTILGISQQAVSERLRRGHRALIDSALRPEESTIMESRAPE